VWGGLYPAKYCPMRRYARSLALLLCGSVRAQEAVLAERQRILADYDRETRPRVAQAATRCPGGCNEDPPPPELVSLQFYLTRIQDLIEVEKSFALEGYMRLWWNDPRLAYNASVAPDGFMAFQEDEQTALWLPDLYWEDSREVEFGGGHGALMWVTPSGDVWWSRKGRIVVRCDLDFRYVPFDVQTCKIRGGSYSKNWNQVRIEWKKSGEPGENQTIPFDASWADRHLCYRVYDPWRVLLSAVRDVRMQYSTSSWSYIEAEFTLVRNLHARWVFRFLVLPFIYVFLAWLSFVIEAEFGVDRIAVTIIAILITYENYTAFFELLPTLAYDPVIARYVLGSFVFNLMSCLAACIENYGERQKEYLKKIDAERTKILETVDGSDSKVTLGAVGLIPVRSYTRQLERSSELWPMEKRESNAGTSAATFVDEHAKAKGEAMSARETSPVPSPPTRLMPGLPPQPLSQEAKPSPSKVDLERAGPGVLTGSVDSGSVGSEPPPTEDSSRKPSAAASIAAKLSAVTKRIRPKGRVNELCAERANLVKQLHKLAEGAANMEAKAERDTERIRTMLLEQVAAINLEIRAARFAGIRHLDHYCIWLFPAAYALFCAIIAIQLVPAWNDRQAVIERNLQDLCFAGVPETTFEV
jgi:hypothetical protein